jgi:phosphate transport system permease protein
LVLVELSKDQNFMTEEVTLSAAVYALPTLSSMPFKILISPDQRWVMAVDRDANLSILDIKDRLNPRLNAVHKLSGYALNDVQLLLGGSTLTVADVSGAMSQWFMIRDQNNHWALAHIRDFDQQDGPQLLAMEHRRRGFATGDAEGNVALFSATAGVQVHQQRLIKTPIQFIAMSPRANAMLVENNTGQLSFWQVDNKHPDTSWKALWHKIWYEGYENPEYIWQSSASSNDFEPKYSLMPLAFGTLKSAFYAMLMATPLAICGAIYTAYFMAPALRRKVKPLIELMEALPTVILGFLAGLWLAPFIETNLASVFTLFVVVPFGTLLFAYLWAQLPKDLGWQLPIGWDVLIIIPVVLALAWLSMPISDALEASLFGGNMRQWVSRDLGINFDQRNALVVGIAMGFAVIPTIFSITEDAIFSVPKHLTQGSLALGATPWQTLTRVVIPTASPGIFSAVMIGMGRAVGETMIVLMATGNTPIMDMNIFEGMRTLAANIAVEMPESEVGGSHFRILFLAALVLFAFTFMVNTLAEVVRQRLRQKYGSL